MMGSFPNLLLNYITSVSDLHEKSKTFLTPAAGKLNPSARDGGNIFFGCMHFLMYFFFFISAEIILCTNSKTLQVSNIIGLFLCICKKKKCICIILPCTSEWGRAKPELTCCCRDLVVRITDNWNPLHGWLEIPVLLARDRWLFCHLSWFEMTDWC